MINIPLKYIYFLLLLFSLMSIALIFLFLYVDLSPGFFYWYNPVD